MPKKNISFKKSLIPIIFNEHAVKPFATPAGVVVIPVESAKHLLGNADVQKVAQDNCIHIAFRSADKLVVRVYRIKNSLTKPTEYQFVRSGKKISARTKPISTPWWLNYSPSEAEISENVYKLTDAFYGINLADFLNSAYRSRSLLLFDEDRMFLWKKDMWIRYSEEESPPGCRDEVSMYLSLLESNKLQTSKFDLPLPRTGRISSAMGLPITSSGNARTVMLANQH